MVRSHRPVSHLESDLWLHIRWTSSPSRRPLRKSRLLRVLINPRYEDSYRVLYFSLTPTLESSRSLEQGAQGPAHAGKAPLCALIHIYLPCLSSNSLHQAVGSSQPVPSSPLSRVEKKVLKAKAASSNSTSDTDSSDEDSEKDRVRGLLSHTLNRSSKRRLSQTDPIHLSPSANPQTHSRQFEDQVQGTLGVVLCQYGSR